MKHTPGPWAYDRGIFPFGAHGEPKPITAIGKIITKVYHIRNEEETIANAKLIAAAPDLLDSLQIMIKIMKEYHEEIGGCNHEVGVCLCGEYAILDNAQEIIDTITGK